MSNVRPGRHKQYAKEVESSGSWSDVSDYDFSLPYSVNYVDSPDHSRHGRSSSQTRGFANEERQNLSLGVDVTDEPISNPGPDSEQTDEDISVRLTKSLDLGHGSFGYSGNEDFDASFIRDDESWEPHTDPCHPSRQTQTLPRGGSGRFNKLKVAKDEAAKTDTDGAEKIKSKFMSAWNNMRHGLYSDK